MRSSFYGFIAVFLFLFLAPARHAAAQISVGINLGGGAPECPYGYYGYAPYNCAPTGYYGPEWFSGGEFVGAGPWHHDGDGGFQGRINHNYDPRYGYQGGFPDHGGGHGDGGQNGHGFHGTYRADTQGNLHGSARGWHGAKSQGNGQDHGHGGH